MERCIQCSAKLLEVLEPATWHLQKKSMHFLIQRQFLLITAYETCRINKVLRNSHWFHRSFCNHWQEKSKRKSTKSSHKQNCCQQKHRVESQLRREKENRVDWPLEKLHSYYDQALNEMWNKKVIWFNARSNDAIPRSISSLTYYTRWCEKWSNCETWSETEKFIN